MSNNVNDKLSQPFRFLSYVKDYIMGENCIGGPRLVKLSTVINLFKAGTLPYCIWLMNKYDKWNSPTMTLYTGLHGAYGLVWLLKEYVSPDRGWDHWITIPSVLGVSVLPLGMYWYTPYLIASTTTTTTTTTSSTQNNNNKKEEVVAVEASPRRRIAATLTFVLGTTIMFGSDIQKYFVLKARPGLITDGFFGLCRHPNYLGEMMLYGAFAMLAPTITTTSTTNTKYNLQIYAPWAILGTVWGIVFSTQMLQKETRMSRHEGWAEYVKKTAALIPFVF